MFCFWGLAVSNMQAPTFKYGYADLAELIHANYSCPVIQYSNNNHIIPRLSAVLKKNNNPDVPRDTAGRVSNVLNLRKKKF